MKRLIFVVLLLWSSKAYSQLEITTGYAVNKNMADGPSLLLAYDFNIYNQLFTKSQVGYKYLFHFNDYVGATIQVSILEFHQTLSYEIAHNRKYICKPNIGINYRFYNWKGQMKPPYNSLPQRVYKIQFRDDRLRLNSFAPVANNDGNYTDKYSVSNMGFSFQLQNQFRINGKIWLHITPFLEPDYDGTQTTGGCYAGVIWKSL
jgi:hypothetical protein